MRRLVAGAIAMMMLGGAAAAHHSPAAFDRTTKLELKGTVTLFRWQNPHTFIELDVPGKKGVEKWVVELTSPTYLVRSGWKNNSVKPGDKVTVVVNPLKERDQYAGIFVSITLADGRTLTESPPRLGGAGPTK
jgi:Family of unknown function (DUF6152)